MASTFVNDLRLAEMATGDNSGSWGTVTNTNLELIGDAFGFGTEAITTNNNTHETLIANGAADAGRSMFLRYTGTLDSPCTITISAGASATDFTISKLWFIENATTGGENIIITSGSGADVTIPAGDVKVIYTNGAGSGGAVVDAFASLSVVDLKVQDDLTVTDDVDIGGALTMSGGGDGAVSFSTASSIKILDNNAASLVFEEANAAYMTFVTTNSSEAVKFDVGVNMAETALVTGVLTTTAATVSNGGGQFNGTLTVGVDDTGYDVKFFGATASAFMQWKASTDDLLLGGASRLGIGTASPSTGLSVVTGSANGIELGQDSDSSTDSARLFFSTSNGSNAIHSSNGIMRFFTGSTAGSSTGTERFTIAADGAATFNGTLSVGGTVDISGAIVHTGDTNTFISFNAADQIQVVTGGAERVAFYNNETHFNDGHVDMDFIVESDGLAHALFVDGGEDRVCIGTSASNLTLASALGTSRLTVADGIMFGTSAGTNSYVGTGDTAGDLALVANAAPGNLGGTRSVRIKGGTSGGGGPNEIAAFNSNVGSIFNDGAAAAQDFKVKSNGNANMLFVDGGANTVQVATTLTFGGSLNVSSGGIGVGESGSLYRRMYWNESTNTMRFWNGSNEAIINTAGAFVDASDVRLKKDIADIEYGIDTVKSLKPRKYKMKDTDSEQIGFVAQEMEAHIPEVVSTGIAPDGDEQKGISYGQLTAVLTKAIQEQQTLIEALTARIKALES